MRYLLAAVIAILGAPGVFQFLIAEAPLTSFMTTLAALNPTMTDVSGVKFVLPGAYLLACYGIATMVLNGVNMAVDTAVSAICYVAKDGARAINHFSGGRSQRGFISAEATVPALAASTVDKN